MVNNHENGIEEEQLITQGPHLDDFDSVTCAVIIYRFIDISQYLLNKY